MTENNKKEYIAPEYTVVTFDNDEILTATSGGCPELWSAEVGTDCKENYLPLS